ncbi:MAG: ABC transporter permease [Candidatus Woesearchaeota archaeon]
MVLQHLRAQWAYLKISIKTALEYRVNFIVQISSMILNDIVWMVFWLIIFNKFQQINGWNIKDMLLLYTVILTSYGITGVFFGNRSKIAISIVEGKLDYYMTLPKNILYHLLVSRSSWFSLGDLLLGIFLAILYIPLHQVPLFVLLTLLSSIIILAFSVISGSLAFFMSNSEETCRTLNMGLISFASYPLSIYNGMTRILIFFVIPAGFVSGIPVELLKSFSMEWLMYMIGFTVLITSVAAAIFYYGLRKYESGNLLYVRT